MKSWTARMKNENDSRANQEDIKAHRTVPAPKRAVSARPRRSRLSAFSNATTPPYSRFPSSTCRALATASGITFATSA